VCVWVGGGGGDWEALSSAAACQQRVTAPAPPLKPPSPHPPREWRADGCEGHIDCSLLSLYLSSKLITGLSAVSTCGPPCKERREGGGVGLCVVVWYAFIKHLPTSLCIINDRALPSQRTRQGGAVQCKPLSLSLLHSPFLSTEEKRENTQSACRVYAASSPLALHCKGNSAHKLTYTHTNTHTYTYVHTYTFGY
jgi:hypothetical protein